MAEYRTMQTGTSPFRFEPGERLVEANTGSPNTIRLSELDRLLLGVINRVLIVNGSLAHRYLEEAGMRESSLEDIRACLRRLADNGYLNRLRFRTAQGQSSLQAYTLAELGRRALENGGRIALRTGYVEHMDSLHAKRQLAALQFVIAHGYVPDAARTSYGRLIRELQDATGSHLFRSQAVIRTQEKTVFVEVVRDNPGSSEELARKLERIQATLRDGNRLNLMTEGEFEVVVVAESYPHMTRLMGEVEAAVPPNLRESLFFTNDQDTFFRSGRLNVLPEKRNTAGKILGKLVDFFRC